MVAMVEARVRTSAEVRRSAWGGGIGRNGQVARWLVATLVGAGVGLLYGRAGETQGVAGLLIALAVQMGLLALWSP
jgi:hypothetical protein